MNLLQISEALKGVPKQFLVQEATQPSGRYPQFMVVAELSRRTSMEKRFRDSIHMGNTPQTTIKDQAIQEATAPMPTSTTVAMGQMRPNMNTGLRSVGAGGGMVNMLPSEPRGQETMGMPAAVRMYEGGRIGMKHGGIHNFQAEGKPLTPLARQGIENRINEILTGSDFKILDAPTQIELRRLQEQLAQDDANKPLSPTPSYQAALEKEKQATLERQGPIYDEVVQRPDLVTAGKDASTIGEVGNLERTTEALVNAIDAQQQAQENYNNDPTPENQEKLNAANERVNNAERITKLRADATVGEVADDFKKQKEKLETEAPKAPSTETDSVDTKTKLEELKKGLKQPTLDDYKLGEMKFTETLDSPEAFQAKLDGMRKVDYIGKMEANFNKMKEGVEKDKRQALSLSVVEAGINIATTASPDLLAALGGGVKAGFNKWSAIQKDVKAAELELTKAENSLLAARDARQEGDIKAYKQYEKEHKAAEREAEKFNINARNKAVELLAADTRNFNTLLNNLNVTTIQQDAANARNKATLNMRKYAAELNASTESKKAIAKNITDYQKQLNDRTEKARDRLKDYQVTISKGTQTFGIGADGNPTMISTPVEITPQMQAYIDTLKADLAQSIADEQEFRKRLAGAKESRKTNATDYEITDTSTMKGGGFISYPSGGINISRS